MLSRRRASGILMAATIAGFWNRPEAARGGGPGFAAAANRPFRAVGTRPSGEFRDGMQLGSIARWLKGDSRFWEGERFTVTVEGRGERDVVFVHGLAASPECWEEAPARLGPDMRLHFVHMRGFAGLPPT